MQLIHSPEEFERIFPAGKSMRVIDEHLMIVCGPIGSGKTTLVHALTSECPLLVEAVSHTTREPRPGEECGVDYHFVSPEEFDQIDFVESVEYHGNRYGLARSTLTQLVKAGKDIVVIVETQGLEALLEAYPAATVLLVLVPSVEVLRSRLGARGTGEAAQRRLDMAREEMSQVIRVANYLVMNTAFSAAEVEMKGIYTEMVQRRTA